MFKLSKCAVTAVFPVLLAGCSGGTLDCSDVITKETVVDIVVSNIQTAVWGREAFDREILSNFDVTNIKTLGYDDATDRYHCAASLDFELKGNPKSFDIEYVNSYLEEAGDTEVAVYDINDIKGKLLFMVAATGG